MNNNESGTASKSRPYRFFVRVCCLPHLVFLEDGVDFLPDLLH